MNLIARLIQVVLDSLSNVLMVLSKPELTAGPKCPSSMSPSLMHQKTHKDALLRTQRSSYLRSGMVLWAYVMILRINIKVKRNTSLERNVIEAEIKTTKNINAMMNTMNGASVQAFKTLLRGQDIVEREEA